MKTYLDFEAPIAELDQKIEALHGTNSEVPVDLSKELTALTKKSNELTAKIYGDLTAWQITKVARHAERPYTLDYVNTIFTDFVEMHGDRHFADDQSIVGGLARLNGTACMVIGHQKGRDTKERTLRNFGMTRPEGYRKALRLMEMADRFGLPVISLVDTAGAYPGIGAEERGQAEAIARSTETCLSLGVPNVAVILGEGGSGGAIAIATANRVLMLEPRMTGAQVLACFEHNRSDVVGFLRIAHEARSASCPATASSGARHRASWPASDRKSVV